MTILISFFSSFRKKRKLVLINFFFVFFSISIPFYSSHSHPCSPHSHPDSLHSDLNSPRSHPDSTRSHHSPHSVPRFPILAFTDSHIKSQIYVVSKNKIAYLFNTLPLFVYTHLFFRS